MRRWFARLAFGKTGTRARRQTARAHGSTARALRLERLETRALPSVLAFPGAEGYGAYTVGGRGGDVYHVTNLLDEGPGSFRYGVENADGPRTVVFDVAGNIDLKSDLAIAKPYLTIAGQTAPGLGITLCRNSVFIADTHDVIVRYLRFRHGDIHGPFVPGFEQDTMTLYHVQNVILDHVSVSWSLDETLSVLGPAIAPSDRVTVQWSMVTEGLRNAKYFGSDSMGSLITSSNGGYSFHHNLYAHHDWRSPLAEGEPGGPGLRFDFINNVVYNWGGLAGHSGPNGYLLRMNYVNNYVVAGPSTPSFVSQYAYWGFTKDARIYQAGNRIDSDYDRRLDGIDTGWGMFYGKYTRQSHRFPWPGIQQHDALTAYRRVLAEAGASRARDSVDVRIVNEVMHRTGRVIDSQDDVGGWPEIPPADAPADADQDGMPDVWELRYGLDPNNPEDRNGDLNRDGYTNLEEYLNGLRPNTSLIGHWALDDASGKVAADSAEYGTANSGALRNGARFVQAGRIDGAVALDGVDDYVTLPRSADADYDATGQRTISVWFKAANASLARKQVIYGEGNESRGLDIYLQKGQLYVGGWNVPRGWRGTFLRTGNISSGDWRQVVLVLDGGTLDVPGTLRAYLDGVQFGEGKGAAVWSDGGSIGLGGLVSKARFHNGIFSPKGRHFAGVIDDSQIYNRALAASEIQTLFNQAPVQVFALREAADYGTNQQTGAKRLNEVWDEALITYNNAPANADSGASNRLNAAYAALLGKFHPQRSKGVAMALDSTTALVDFLNADTNSSATFIVSSASSSTFGTFASVVKSFPCPVSCAKMLWESGRLIVGGPSGIAELDPGSGKWVVLSDSATSRWGFVATPDAVYFTRGAELLTVPRPRRE